MENIGKTKATSYQVGIRKTFPVTQHEAWQYLFSDKGIQTWLGYYGSLDWVRGQEYITKYGTHICVRIHKELSHVRLKYRKKNWDNNSTIQLRIIPAKTGITISFHQENLNGAAQRQEMKIHWDKVLYVIEKDLNKFKH
jgi:ribosome-associated translation inhibitor RaiA